MIINLNYWHNNDITYSISDINIHISITYPHPIHYFIKLILKKKVRIVLHLTLALNKKNYSRTIQHHIITWENLKWLNLPSNHLQVLLLKWKTRNKQKCLQANLCEKILKMTLNYGLTGLFHNLSKKLKYWRSTIHCLQFIESIDNKTVLFTLQINLRFRGMLKR